MRSVLTHAALLLAALAVAYQTWNIDDTAVALRDAILIWNSDQEELASIMYKGPDKRVVLEQRRDDAGTYLWGTLIRGAASASGSTEAVDTTQFIVGEQADFLLRALAMPRAIRDLGAVDAEREQEYGLADAPGHLTVSFGGGERELLIGGSVFATGDRYVKDPSSGRVYVVISSTIHGIENAESVLLERQLHAFDLSDVMTVTVRTAGNERTMRQARGSASPAWTPPDAPDQPSQTFANFMNRLEQLWVVSYAPAVDRDSLRMLARIEYLDANGRAMGHVELFRADGEDGPEYLVATEHTRMLAHVHPTVAEPLEADVMQLF